MTEKEVIEKFAKGFDCSQVVFGEMAERLGIDSETALKISACFGGGMWNGEVCGAVSGALMAIGAKYGHAKDNDPQKAVMQQKLTEFITEFKKENGEIVCRKLLGNDLSKPDELKIIMEKGLLRSYCPKVVVSAISILEKVLND